MSVAPDSMHRAARTLRSVALVVAIWVAFFGMQVVLSLALARRGPDRLMAQIQIDLIIAVLWASLSFLIAGWHGVARARAPSALALLALHMPMLFVAAIADTAVTQVAMRVLEPTRQIMPFWAFLVYYADFDIVSYAAVVAVVEALLVRRALLARQRMAGRLETSLSRARLDYLEAQLHPHFLFNSLGAVSELAYDAPATASRMLHQLIAVYRTALAGKTDEITLGEEISGIEPYLDIQRIRFADWLTIEYHIADAAVDCLLPRFILQPLIENAIRHGLSGRSAAGTIDISATVSRETLIVRVADNGVGLIAAAPSAGRGIGLANVRDRLAIMYGDDERLRLTSSEMGGTIAELTIPVRRRDQRMAAPRDDGGPASMGGELPALRVPRWFRRPAVAIGVTWLLCGLMWTQQNFVYRILRGQPEVPWLWLARNEMASALVWALLTPLLLVATGRFPLHPDRRGRLLGYLGGGLVTPLVHVGVLQLLTSRPGPLLSPTWNLTLIIDFVIYCVLVSVGHRKVLVEWLRAREAAAAELTAAVAVAQARAATLQAIPPILLRSLDGISETARRDPALTERQLTRLADYLRLALESTDEDGLTFERERALESALAALRETGAYSHDLTLTA